MRAYRLTSAVIEHALVVAKLRGVDVEAIFDKTQDATISTAGCYSDATAFAKAGIPVWIDDKA